MDYLWAEPTYTDSLPLEPNAPEMPFSIGDSIVAHLLNGVTYNGYVCDTDPVEQKVLARIWDRESGAWRKAWWDISQIKGAA